MYLSIYIALLWKKVCYRAFLCENSQRRICKAFIGLSVRAEMIAGDVPFYIKFLPKLYHPLPKCQFSEWSLCDSWTTC